MWVGVSVDSRHALRLVDRGPPADDKGKANAVSGCREGGRERGKANAVSLRFKTSNNATSHHTVPHTHTYPPPPDPKKNSSFPLKTTNNTPSPHHATHKRTTKKTVSSLLGPPRRVAALQGRGHRGGGGVEHR